MERRQASGASSPLSTMASITASDQPWAVGAAPAFSISRIHSLKMAGPTQAMSPNQ